MRFLTRRAEVIALCLLLLFSVVVNVLPQAAPFGVHLRDTFDGSAIALQAIGIVLVFRSNRIINFAQVQMGAVAGLLFVELVYHLQFVRFVGLACGCVDVQDQTVGLGQFTTIRGVSSGTANVLYQLNYWLSAVLAFALVLGLSWLLYTFIVRRFNTAPRLVLTVVTIGLGQVFALLRGLVPKIWDHGDGPQTFIGTAPLPFDWHFTIAPAVFHSEDILTALVAVAAVIGLGLFLRFGRTGVALRGSSENPQRAATLGVKVNSVTARAWVIAGGLSAIASLLTSVGGTSSQGSSSDQVLVLAAAVIGGLVSLPLTVVAAIVLSVVRGSVVWAYQTPVLFDGFLLAIVVGILLIQRRRASRTDDELSSTWEGTREARPIPPELRSIPTVRRSIIWSSLTGGAVILALPVIMSPSQANLATVTMLYAIVGLSLLILTGWAGQISLGQFAFAAVGAYVAAVAHLPFLLAILAGGIAGSIVAVLIGLPALRLRGLYLAITTLAFALATESILLSPAYLGKFLPSQLDRPSFLGIDLGNESAYYYFTLVFVVLAVLATVGLRRSRTARALIASRDNEALAQSYGINLVRARLSAFALSGFMAAFAGGLFAYAEFGVNSQSFTPDVSLTMFLMVVIGGLGSITGALIGATYLGVLFQLSSNPLISEAGTGILVVALLMFAPGGLGQIAFAVRDAMLRRVADRNRIDVPSLTADRRATVGSAVPLAPKTRRGGGKIFIPERYRMPGQWALRGGGKEK